MEETERVLFERGLRHALDPGTGADLDEALGALGWHEALDEDPRTAVSALFELQGATDADSEALAAVLGHGLGWPSARTGRVLLPPPGHAGPPGTLEGAALTVRGLTTARGSDGSPVVVATRTGGKDVVVEVSAAHLTLRPVAGVAPHLGLVEVVGTDVPFTARQDLDAGDWPEAVALCRLAVGHELVGASRSMLDQARVHALQRIQFGRPISSFQAVRHRLADALVAVEAADAALQSAWDERSPASAAMARALAGRSARVAARHGQQVLAGIGFTTEHGFHRSFRRVLVLDELFGSAASLTRELGRQLLATGTLPPLPPLSLRAVPDPVPHRPPAAAGTRVRTTWPGSPAASGCASTTR